MIRLALLTTAAFLLPNMDAKSNDLGERPGNIASVTNAVFPGIRFPKFLRVNRKHGAEIEIAQMKTRLRDLVVQEESYFAKNGIYGRHVNRVAGLAPGDTTAQSVQVEILWAGKKGWSAVASHPNAPGRSCVMFVGAIESLPIVPRTRQDANVATVEGVAACDAK